MTFSSRSAIYLSAALLFAAKSFGESVEITDAEVSAPDSTVGVQSVFVDLLQYPDEAPSYTRDEMVANANAMCAYFHDYSYGATTLVPTVTQTFLMMPHPASYYAGSRSRISQDAHLVAAANGYGDINAYDHIVYAFPWTASMGHRGFTIGKEIWMDDSISPWLLTHEMGHSYGLFHAHRWVPCDVSNPVDSCGTELQYGDCWDMMGSQGPSHDFNPFEKNRLGWVEADRITNATVSGTYRIHRFDSPQSNTFERLAVTVPQPGTSRVYWVTYRYTPAGTRLGANVMWTGSLASTLIDFYPATTGCRDTVVPVGATLSDQTLQITPTAIGGVSPDFWIDVLITL